MTHRARVALAFTPQWEGPIEKWACKFIHANKWRCDIIHSFDDLLQEAFIVFDRVARKYPRVNSPQNFMGLFKMALSNHVHDHARYSRRKRDYLGSEDAAQYAKRVLGEATNNGYLNALIAEAPDEVQRALDAFDDPITCAALRQRKHKRGKLRGHENLNGRLCRVTGAKSDLVGAIKALLT